MNTEECSMHYTEVDNLIPVILAAQGGDDEAMS